LKISESRLERNQEGKELVKGRGSAEKDENSMFSNQRKE